MTKAESGPKVRPKASTTASPIRRIRTSVGMAGGSLAERPQTHQRPRPDCTVERASTRY